MEKSCIVSLLIFQVTSGLIQEWKNVGPSQRIAQYIKHAYYTPSYVAKRSQILSGNLFSGQCVELQRSRLSGGATSLRDWPNARAHVLFSHSTSTYFILPQIRTASEVR